MLNGAVVVVSLCLAVSAWAETRALVVSGLGGEPRYEAEFRETSEQVARRLGEVIPHVVLLAGGRATREQIEVTFGAFAAQAESGDSLVFVYVGHGSYDGRTFRFNVPGRDFDAAELRQWLTAVPAGERVMVVTGSASGALHDLLAGAEVALYTATRSGNEKNATQFPRLFANALAAEAADIDKDEQVSVHEAFRFAEAAVIRQFALAKQLASEHARHSGPEAHLILGNVVEPGLAWVAEAPGGRVRLPKDLDDPALEQRREIEAAIDELRSRRSRLEPGDYFARLQELLLELAMVEQQIEDGKIGFDDIFAEQPGAQP